MMPKIVAEPGPKAMVISFLSTAIPNETEVGEAAAALNHYMSNAAEKTIILDLSRVRIMSSAMIGELVKFRKNCQQQNKKLKLCGLNGDVREVFRITKMDKLFKIYENRKKAGGA
jgi:anti-sigma B factor antagonist